MHVESWILEFACICRELKYAIVLGDLKRLREGYDKICLAYMYDLQRFARIPYVNTQARRD